MVVEFSGLEGQVEEPEQKTDTSVLLPGEVPELDDNGLDEIISEYKPSLMMKGLVAVLRGTSTPIDHIDYSEMKKLERIFKKYIIRPITRPKDYILRPLAGFGVRVAVGGTSGEIMTEAATYLEKELGIKETPLEYTRNNLISALTIGVVTVLSLSGLGFSMPAIIPTSAALGPVFAIANPIAYICDMTRRLWLYSQKKPSGPWLFEGIWWAKNKVKQYVIDPLKECMSETVIPKLKQFYSEKVEPNLVTMLDNFQYYNYPLNPGFYRTFPTPTECDEPDDSDIGTKESAIYDYTVIKDTGRNPDDEIPDSL